MRLTDPIAMEVFSNRLLSITEDMGNTLIRSSFSTNIKERKDCSVALFDAGGRLIAQASHIPLHLGSLLGSVQAVLAHLPAERMRDGDAFICNDPYLANGTHMPDISVITPVFLDGRVRFFAANVGHHSDVGGPVPGSISGRARSVFEEGLRLPVIRIVRAGELDEDLLALIAHNTRDPDERTLEGPDCHQRPRRPPCPGPRKPHGLGCSRLGDRGPAVLHRRPPAQQGQRDARRLLQLCRVSRR